MSFIALIDITRPDEDFPPEGAIPVLNLPGRQDRDLWIPRLIRAKRPFAIASLDAVSQEEVTRLAETCRRRKLPVAILNAYRLIPVFARLREVVVSGCLGTMEAVQVHVPAAMSAVLCADLALWLLPAAPPEALSITADNRLTIVATGSNAKANKGEPGEIDFGTIRYTQDQIGIHTYTVTETTPGGKISQTGNTSFTVKVEVYIDTDGSLKGQRVLNEFVNAIVAIVGNSIRLWQDGCTAQKQL